jgi:hypothetical protein
VSRPLKGWWRRADAEGPDPGLERLVSGTDLGDLVAALRAVPGVSEADVEPDAEGGVGLLMLDLLPDVDEVAVTESVGRLLREQFGLGVDEDRVEFREDGTDVVDEIAVPVPAVPAQRSGGRPTISRMHLVSSGLDVVATVSLGQQGRTGTGEARGTASPTGIQHAVATATLRAVEELAAGALRLELTQLEVARLGSQRTVLVALGAVTSRGEERLTGAAVVYDDVRQAVIRATLDALNRRLEALLLEP